MRVKKLEIENFRGFSATTLDELPAIVILVGENDSGKTTLLEGLRLILEWSQGTSSNPQLGDIADKHFLWFAGDSERSIKVGATLTLNDGDRAALSQAIGEGTNVGDQLDLVLLIERDGDNVYRRWESISGFGLPELNTPPGLQPIAFQGGSATVAIEASGVQISAVAVGTAVENFVKGRFKFVGVYPDRAISTLGDQWWVRPPLLRSETEVRLRSMASLTSPIAEKKWNSWRDWLRPVIGPLDVKQNDIVTEKSIGETRFSLPISLDGGGYQTYLNYIDQFEAETPIDVIALEEPENHLHPKLIKHLMKEIEQRADKGRQFFIVTHSPFVINARPPTDSWWVWQEAGEAKTRRVDDKEETTQILLKIGVRPSDFLLSDAVLIVEGASDKVFMSAVARELGRPFYENNILVIDAGGDSKEKPHFEYWCEITHNAPLPKFCLLDKGSKQYRDVLVKAGIAKDNVHILDRGDIEDYYPRDLISEWLSSYPWAQDHGVTDVPIGQTVKVLTELVPGKSDWWKKSLAEFVAQGMTKDSIEDELSDYVNSLYSALDT
jgi:energy-coupling factor transporter ATP-binding protein EcfA2